MSESYQWEENRGIPKTQQWIGLLEVQHCSTDGKWNIFKTGRRSFGWNLADTIFSCGWRNQQDTDSKSGSGSQSWMPDLLAFKARNWAYHSLLCLAPLLLKYGIHQQQNHLLSSCDHNQAQVPRSSYSRTNMWSRTLGRKNHSVSVIAQLLKGLHQCPSF